MNRHSLNPGYLFTTTLVCLVLALPAVAQNQFDLNTLEPGQLILNLSATEQTNVEQDTLNVFMQYTAQGRNSTALQGEVNKATIAVKMLPIVAGRVTANSDDHSS